MKHFFHYGVKTTNGRALMGIQYSICGVVSTQLVIKFKEKIMVKDWSCDLLNI